MKFFAVVLLAVCFHAYAAESAAAPAIQVSALASPAGPTALGATLATAPDGTVWLSWVEPATGDTRALRFATFDTAAQKWRAPSTIASGANIAASSADFPQLAVAPAGRVVAMWGDGHDGIWFSESANAGATWSAPTSLVNDGHAVEMFALAVLADGRVLAAWLDGRGINAGGKTQQLFARILGQSGPDILVDPSVCDCCQTALTAFPDGGALLAFRGRTAEEVRDIRTARFDGRAWAESRPLNNDDWRLLACPVNGPRLASDGGRVAAAWFTAADNDARVLASFSPDAGARFLQPLRIDQGKPIGHVDTLILHDGALLVSWVESDGSVWLRRVTPDFTADQPVRLTPAGATNAKTFPRLALLRDYAGGKTSAQFIAVFASEGVAPLRTLLVTVPEGELLNAEKNCDCAPTAEQLQGFPVRGTIAAIDVNRGVLRVKHDEAPGVLAAGTHEFAATPDIIATVQTGRQFLGRIERRNGAWRLFDVRLLVAQ